MLKTGKPLEELGFLCGLRLCVKQSGGIRNFLPLSAKLAKRKGHKMDERIKQITSDLKKVADETQATFGGLSSEQLNWKPAAESWSVGQCFEHIIKTNEQFYPSSRSSRAALERIHFSRTTRRSTGFFGRFLIKAVSETRRKRRRRRKRSSRRATSAPISSDGSRFTSTRSIR
jgi:hypothetical protein